MTTYVALFRGINVAGRSKVAMGDLRSLFEALGYDGVRTYIQSGNVVFRGRKADAGAIEKRVAADLGVEARVLLRTADDLAAVAAGNPFLGRKVDVAKLHVTFLSDAPRATLAVPAGRPDELAVVGREVYLYCPDGYGRTKVHNAYIEKRSGLVATTRNWKTVLTLADLSAAEA